MAQLGLTWRDTLPHTKHVFLSSAVCAVCLWHICILHIYKLMLCESYTQMGFTCAHLQHHILLYRNICAWLGVDEWHHHRMQKMSEAIYFNWLIATIQKPGDCDGSCDTTGEEHACTHHRLNSCCLTKQLHKPAHLPHQPATVNKQLCTQLQERPVHLH